MTYYTHWQPTQYLGITFKSKLECRWYILFTRLGLAVTYEPRQYYIPELAQTAEQWYTPDFGLLAMPYPVVEIKPNLRNAGGVVQHAILKLRSISNSGTPCALIAGSCWPGEFDIIFFKHGEVHQPRLGLLDKVRLTFGISKKEAASVVALKLLLGGWKGDYMAAFRYAYEVVK